MKNKKNLFIIDDDEAIGQSLKDILDSYYDVELFTKAKSAIQDLEERKPDGVLLDYFLPGENTPEVIQSVRSYSDTLPIIIMSANLNLVKNKEKLAVQEFLEKPFSLDMVLSSLSRYI